MGGFENDPFAVFTTPPPNETPEQKAERERNEAEAQRISDKIDDEIKAERAALKKQKGIVRILLLGQSESGKSTTLKNFRMKYARAAWKQERASWRAVIQLNLIRSIITIVETLQAEMDNEPLEDPSEFDETSSHSTIDAISVTLTDKHQLLKRRLGPLRRVETDLKKRLGAGSVEVEVGEGVSFGEMDSSPLGSVRRGKDEFCVRGWKDALEVPPSPPHRSVGPGGGDAVSLVDQLDEATEVIASCKEDMEALWTDNAVRAVLKKRKLRMEDSAGFFLDDLDRIATRAYEPSDNDVVRARLRTLGVQEYRIQFEPGSGQFLSNVGLGADFGREWVIYDVGGSRTIRHAWLPYFDNINAIIFLAPISCFDERLVEDPRVNRLEDSILLWRAICSSKLLSKTTIILFLNKCDLLKRKLKSGIQIRNYLPSYGDRSNDASTVVKYMREKFKDILKQKSPEPRVSYYYATSVTDTKATATTLKAVRDSILREHLKSADFV